MVKLREFVTDELSKIITHINFYVDEKDKQCIYIDFDDNASKEIEDLAEEIVKRSRQSLNEEGVKKELQETLADILRSDQRDAHNFINQKVGSLLHKLKAKKYNFIVKVYGIGTSRTRRFGGLKFFPNKKTLAKELGKQIKGSINSPIFSKFSQDAKNVRVSYSFVMVEVEAGDAEAAELKALNKIELHLKALSLLSRGYNFLIGKEVIPSTKSVIYIDPINSLHKRVRAENIDLLAHPINLDECYKKSKRLLKKLDDLLRDDRKREINNKIIAAISWYGESLREFSNEEKLLKLVIALESLLLKGEQCKRKNLVERASYLCIKKKRRVVYKMVDEAYRHRNSLVHEGKTKEYLSKYFIDSLAELVRQLIIFLIMKDEFSTLGDVIEYVDKKRRLT